MNDPVRESLRRLTKERPKTLGQPRLLEAWLRDLHPDRPARVAAAVEVVASGGLEVLRRAGPADVEARVQALVQGSGLSPRLAWWAVDAWLDALGRVPVIAAADPSPAPRPRSRAPDPRRLGDVLRAAVDAANKEHR